MVRVVARAVRGAAAALGCAFEVNAEMQGIIRQRMGDKLDARERVVREGKERGGMVARVVRGYKGCEGC